MTAFPCTKCGACCLSVDGIDFLKEFNDQGRCKMFVNNECMIYETRPLLCRIDEAYDKIFSPYMSKKQFYEQNALACNVLQKRLGLDNNYRVII